MHSLILATVLFCPPPCDAEQEALRTLTTPRFTLYINAENEQDNSQAEFVDSIASKSLGILNKNFEELSRIFDVKPKKKVVLRFLSPEEFHKQTGSPAWTSAMFFRGEITVPLPANQRVKMSQLSRAIRHEYVHAVVAELSNSKCPAWLDEGIAQLIEGKANSLLGPALRNWLRRDNPLPLDWLDDGFMTLDSNVVPVAYAQSLFATRTLVNTYGFPAIRNYLLHLGQNKSETTAFRLAFNKSRRDFEYQLAPQLYRWARSNRENP